MTHVRSADPRDAALWAQMRHALWPEGPLAEHAEEIDAFFRGGLPDLAAAFVAVGPGETLLGFAELAERPFAEGCATQPVAYLEGWYVAPEARGRGVGRALIAAAEAWGRERGCRELASDTDLENETSAAAHQALGFEEVAIIRCFRRGLDPGAVPQPGHKAAKPNPLLEPLSVLAGSWHTKGTHPLVPGTTFHGRTTFEWLEGGAFLIMHSQTDEPEIPNAIAVFGTDDVTGECSMLYVDERGISRRYEVSLRENVWRWWREASGLSQRFIGAIAADGRTIAARGEMSRDGVSWEPDLQLTYTRAD